MINKMQKSDIQKQQLMSQAMDQQVFTREELFQKKYIQMIRKKGKESGSSNVQKLTLNSTSLQRIIDSLIQSLCSYQKNSLFYYSAISHLIRPVKDYKFLSKQTFLQTLVSQVCLQFSKKKIMLLIPDSNKCRTSVTESCIKLKGAAGPDNKTLIENKFIADCVNIYKFTIQKYSSQKKDLKIAFGMKNKLDGYIKLQNVKEAKEIKENDIFELKIINRNYRAKLLQNGIQIGRLEGSSSSNQNYRYNRPYIQIQSEDQSNHVRITVEPIVTFIQ